MNEPVRIGFRYEPRDIRYLVFGQRLGLTLLLAVWIAFAVLRLGLMLAGEEPLDVWHTAVGAMAIFVAVTALIGWRRAVGRLVGKPCTWTFGQDGVAVDAASCDTPGSRPNSADDAWWCSWWSS
jgi:hypothetical protein